MHTYRNKKTHNLLYCITACIVMAIIVVPLIVIANLKETTYIAINTSYKSLIETHIADTNIVPVTIERKNNEIICDYVYTTVADNDSASEKGYLYVLTLPRNVTFESKIFTINDISSIDTDIKLIATGKKLTNDEILQYFLANSKLVSDKIELDLKIIPILVYIIGIAIVITIITTGVQITTSRMD